MFPPSSLRRWVRRFFSPKTAFKQNFPSRIDLIYWEWFGGDSPHQPVGDTLFAEARTGLMLTFFPMKNDCSDFIFDAQMRMNPRLDSGMKIRDGNRDFSQKRVLCYHIDVDPTKKREAGIV